MQTPEFKIQPALFVDIDGTVRRSKSGNITPIDNDDIEILPNVTEKLNFFREQGYLVVGITNQGGVAFEYNQPEEVQAMLKYTNELTGGMFDMILGSFFHEKGMHPIFGRRSLLRKPAYGMLVLAESLAFNNGILIEWDSSIVVGDMETDRLCAEAANVEFQEAKAFFNWE